MVMANLIKKKNIYSKNEEDLPNCTNKTLSLIEFNNTRFKCNYENDRKKSRIKGMQVLVTFIIHTIEFFLK